MLLEPQLNLITVSASFHLRQCVCVSVRPSVRVRVCGQQRPVLGRPLLLVFHVRTDIWKFCGSAAISLKHFRKQKTYFRV